MTFDFYNIAQIFTLILTVDEWCVSNCSVTPATVPASMYACSSLTQSQGKKECAETGLV